MIRGAAHVPVWNSKPLASGPEFSRARARKIRLLNTTSRVLEYSFPRT